MLKSTLLLPLFALLLFASCSTTYDLSFKAPEQMKNTYVMENTTTAESKVMGMDVENVTVSNMTYSMEVLGQDEAGNARVGMNYEAIQYEQSAMGQEMIYDSTDPTRSNNPQIAQMYDALLDRTIELIYNPKGQVIGAKGFTEAMDEMLATLPEETREAMQTQFGGDAMLQSMKAMTYYYPEQGKAKIGDSWTVTNQMVAGGMEMIIDSKYTLLEVDNGQAKIQMESDITTDPNAPGLEISGMTMQFDLQGSQTGLLYVDQATSWLDRMELDQQMDGSMKMESEEIGKMDVEMKVNMQQLIRKQE